MTLTATEIRDLARRFEVKPSRALGQNFVVDPNTIRRIVRLAELEPSDQVIEVGAGFGSLTLGLAEAAAGVKAIETDRRLLKALAEVVGEVPNVEVIPADVMKLNMSSVLDGAEHRLVSNLPYNIATVLIADLLETQPLVRDFVVLIQKEVGERLVASPGSKAYGAISVLIAYHCTSKSLGTVPSTVFWPQPSVESVLVRLSRRELVPSVPYDRLKPVVKAAFGQRRKTMRNSMSAVLGVEPDRARAWMMAAGIPERARAEDVDLDGFLRMTQEMDIEATG